MHDDSNTENSTDQTDMSREERCRILEEVWGLGDEEWPGDREQEQSMETIYAEDTAYVEEFKIRPVEVSDDRLEMKVVMRIGGGEAVYYLAADVQYGGDDEGHHVTIRRRSADVVDEFETDVVTASPDCEKDAVQAIHETYLKAVNDWYEHARAADTVGENHD